MFAFKKYHIFKNVKPSLHVNKDKLDPLANLSGINMDRIDNIINKFFITLKGCDLYTAMKHIKEEDQLNEREREWLIAYVKRENEVNKLDVDTITCPRCEKQNLSLLYCTKCIRDKLKDDFKNWTSGNKSIDNFIRKVQLDTKAPDKIFEWIPYEEFENIKEIHKGGFGRIYTADWINGSISHWDQKSRSFCRIGTENVVLKLLENSNQLDKNLEEQDFFTEIKTHFHLLVKSDRLSWCLGVTKDDKTNDYIIVLSNKKSGDLGKYIRNNPKKLTWKNKLHILADLAEALIIIHEENYAHKDLHPGNILLEDDCNGCHLADLGLSGPVNKRKKELFGVLDYIAPELMKENFEFSIKSDIYALGIIMWVLVTEKIPYGDVSQELYDLLPVKVNMGLRPSAVSGIPEEYNDLMKKCWDPDPKNRPGAEEVYRYAKSLLNKMYNNKLKLEDIFKPIVNAKDEQKLEHSRAHSKIIEYSNSLVVNFQTVKKN